MHSNIAHGACTTLNQQSLPFYVRSVENRMRCGKPRNAKAGRGFKGDIIGQCNSLILRQHDMGCGGAEGPLPLTVPDPDALADTIGVDAVTDRFDDAGTVAVRNHPVIGWPGHTGATSPGFHIRWIYPRICQTYQNLAFCRAGGRHFLHAQHVFGFAEA